MDPLSLLVVGLFIVAIPLVTIVAWKQRSRDKAPPSTRPELEKPVDEVRCPCGAVASHPLPRARVVEIPLIGRWVRRERDGFAVPVVCELHADVAAAYLDEQIAAAKLHEARSERDKLAALANQAAETMASVTASIPEEARRRAKLKPATVRVLKAVNDEGEGGS